MPGRKREFDACGPRAEDDEVESPTCCKHAIDEQRPIRNKAFDRPHRQRMCLRARQIAKRRHRAGVDRQHVECDVAAILAMQRVA